MEIFGTISLQVAIMAILILIGFFITKMGKLTEKGSSDFTFILLNVVTPCVIINSFITLDAGSLSLNDFLMCACLAFLTIGSGLISTLFLFKKQGVSQQKVLKFAISFSNCGFMGIPLAEAVIGARGVVYASLFLSVFNFMLWTFGYKIMTGQKKFTLKKILLNQGLISITIGIIIYVTNVSIPTLLSSPISYMADLNTPVAMLVLGHFLAKISFKEIIFDIRSYQVSLIRLIILPIIVLLILVILRPEYDLFMCVMIQNSTPAATATALFASQMNADAKLASKVVATSTVLSLFTIPIFVVLAQIISGLVL